MDINLLLEPRGSGSPNYYSDSDSTRSECPRGQFYHTDPSPTYRTEELRTTDAHCRPFIESAYATTSDLKRPRVDGDEQYEEAIARLEQRLHEHTAAMETSRERLTCVSPSLSPYQYSPLLPTEVRLLRISPGSFSSPVFCALKAMSLDTIKVEVREFQALSYAWGDEAAECVVYLRDIPRSGHDPSQPGTSRERDSTYHHPFSIRRNLGYALQRIRLTNNYSWIWVDALCIDQRNDEEKSQQISRMPEIYSSAYNVIAWLGEDDDPYDAVQNAIDLIPQVLNLRTLDTVLRGGPLSERILQCWLSFGRLLHRSWFERRWVIQEVACARRLSVRIGPNILSWLDFADAVDLYSENIDRIRSLLTETDRHRLGPVKLGRIKDSRAMALMEMSRNVFRKDTDSGILSRLMSLEALVTTASSFAVSDPRDVIYALLYLANDRDDAIVSQFAAKAEHTFTANYTEHPVDIFIAFVRYCLEKSKSLDIICRPWAMWSGSRREEPYKLRTLPSWVGVAVFAKGTAEPRFVPPDSLLGQVQHQIYSASHGFTMRASIRHSVLHADGILLNLVHLVSACVSDGVIQDQHLRMLSWTGFLEDDVDERLWRTLVANRSLRGRRAPAWYRRASALALTRLDSNGHLDIPRLIADGTQPSMMVDYLTRVHNATENRTVFRSVRNSLAWAGVQGEAADAMIGLGPPNVQRYDMVCILFGCSVPVILRSKLHNHTSTAHDNNNNNNNNNVTLVGPCYIHGYMEGEMFARERAEEVRRESVRFRIH